MYEVDPRKMIKRLQGSVGEYALNFKDDVRSIKLMLTVLAPIHQITGVEGCIYSEISLDEKADLGLFLAIRNFQQKIMGMKLPSGIIYPKKDPTFKKLIALMKKIKWQKNIHGIYYVDTYSFGQTYFAEEEPKKSSVEDVLKMSPAAFIYRLLFLEHTAAAQTKNPPLASCNPNSISAEEVYQSLLPIYRKLRSRYQTTATQASNWYDKVCEKLKHDLHELSNIAAKLKEGILKESHSDKVPFKVGYKDGVISCLLFLIRSYGLENENTGKDLTAINKFLVKQNCYEGHYLNYLLTFKALGLRLDQKCTTNYGFRRLEMTEKKINECLKSGNLILAYVWHSVKGQICQTPNPDHAYMENLNNQAHWVIILSLNPAGEYVVLNPDSGALSHLIWIKSLDEQKPFLAGSEEDYIPTKHLEEISTAKNVEKQIKALQIEVDSTQVSYLVVNRIYPFENYSVAETTSQNVDQPGAVYVSTLKTTEQAIQFIAKHEEFKPNLYDCPSNNATIGYGHLVHLGAVNGTHPAETEEFKKGISKTRATFFLHRDVKEKAEDHVKKYVKVKLKQHQFDALVCFVFSMNPGLFRTSTLLKHINNSNFDHKEIEAAFSLFIKGTIIDKDTKLPVKITLRGLVKRRKNEARLFNFGDYNLSGEGLNKLDSNIQKALVPVPADHVVFAKDLGDKGSEENISHTTSLNEVEHSTTSGENTFESEFLHEESHPKWVYFEAFEETITPYSLMLSNPVEKPIPVKRSNPVESLNPIKSSNPVKRAVLKKFLNQGYFKWRETNLGNSPNKTIGKKGLHFNMSYNAY